MASWPRALHKIPATPTRPAATRGRAFNWPAWQEAFAHAEGLKQIAAETRRAIGSAPQDRTGR